MKRRRHHLALTHEHRILPALCQHLDIAPDSLDAYMNRVPHTVTPVSEQAAIEESFFLGLRLNRGINLAEQRFWEGHDSSRADR